MDDDIRARDLEALTQVRHHARMAREAAEKLRPSPQHGALVRRARELQLVADVTFPDETP